MSVKKKNKKIYEQKKTPQNGGTEGGLVVRQKGRPYASLQILVYHGKNPNARKKCAAGTEKQPDKLFGFLAGTKKPPLEFCGGFILFGLCRGLPPLKHRPNQPTINANYN